MRAGNDFGDDGAASLAPSLLWMAQLTSLKLWGTLACISISCAVSGWLRPPAVHGCCCVLWAEAVARGAVAHGGVCERRAERRPVRAGNQIGDDGAASLAPSLRLMTQLTSLNLNSTLVFIGVSGLALRAGVGCAGGFSGWQGFARGAPRGCGCVQAIKSEQLGRHC